MPDPRPWRAAPGGLELRVRVMPRGGRDAAEGVEALSDGTPVLKVRVRAAPEDGAATEAARRVVAGAAGVPASAVTLRAGATARVKTFAVLGNAGAIAAALDERFPGAEIP